jgi:hypothetical protein
MQASGSAPPPMWRATACAAARCRSATDAQEAHPRQASSSAVAAAASSTAGHSKEDWKRHKREDGCKTAGILLKTASPLAFTSVSGERDRSNVVTVKHLALRAYVRALAVKAQPRQL